MARFQEGYACCDPPAGPTFLNIAMKETVLHEACPSDWDTFHRGCPGPLDKIKP